MPLRVMGCNAMIAYLLTQTPGLHGLSLWQGLCHPLLGGVAALAGPASGVVMEGLSLALLWLLLLVLYRHKLFLRV